MCDVCKTEGLNPADRNGEKAHRMSVKLYRVYQSKVASVNLCYLHTIELFKIGERRFLGVHLSLARELAFRSH